MTIFMSKLKRPVIVVKPIKINSDNDVIQEPMRVYFENNFFQTDDETVIQFMRKLPNFGADYWEVDSVKRVEDTGPQYGVTQMDTPDQKKETEIANIKKDVDGIKNSIEELKGLILQVASKRVEPTTNSDDDMKEEKVDRRVEALAKAREAKKNKE